MREILKAMRAGLLGAVALIVMTTVLSPPAQADEWSSLAGGQACGNEARDFGETDPESLAPVNELKPKADGSGEYVAIIGGLDKADTNIGTFGLEVDRMDYPCDVCEGCVSGDHCLDPQLVLDLSCNIGCFERWCDCPDEGPTDDDGCVEPSIENQRPDIGVGTHAQLPQIDVQFPKAEVMFEATAMRTPSVAYLPIGFGEADPGELATERPTPRPTWELDSFHPIVGSITMHSLVDR